MKAVFMTGALVIAGGIVAKYIIEGEHIFPYKIKDFGYNPKFILQYMDYIPKDLNYALKFNKLEKKVAQEEELKNIKRVVSNVFDNLSREPGYERIVKVGHTISSDSLMIKDESKDVFIDLLKRGGLCVEFLSPKEARGYYRDWNWESEITTGAVKIWIDRTIK